jgi:serine/threonine protein kinase
MLDIFSHFIHTLKLWHGSNSTSFSDVMYLCFRIEGGELFERVICDDFILTEKSCTVFMRQICEGIEFIHKQNILHLDMKVCFII